MALPSPLNVKAVTTSDLLNVPQSNVTHLPLLASKTAICSRFFKPVNSHLSSGLMAKHSSLTSSADTDHDVFFLAMSQQVTFPPYATNIVPLLESTRDSTTVVLWLESVTPGGNDNCIVSSSRPEETSLTTIFLSNLANASILLSPDIRIAGRKRRKKEGKGDSHQIWITWDFYAGFFGLPRGRSVHSSPNRLATSATQLGSPKGRPRLTQQRNAGCHCWLAQQCPLWVKWRAWNKFLVIENESGTTTIQAIFMN